MNWTAETPFQALALTGGGYRGLFTARALDVMERECGPIARHFDLICGTSIGGIVALAAAFEVPMSRVVEVFTKEGLAIFPQHEKPCGLGKFWDLLKYRSKPRYASEVLRSVISTLIPADATLGDASHPLCIPAVNLTEGKPQVFKTRHKAACVAPRLETQSNGCSACDRSGPHVLRTRRDREQSIRRWRLVRERPRSRCYTRS